MADWFGDEHMFCSVTIRQNFHNETATFLNDELSISIQRKALTRLSELESEKM
jgi:hypothetical protein